MLCPLIHLTSPSLRHFGRFAIYVYQFDSNTGDFKLKSNGGITYDIMASGTYKLLDNFIIVNAKEYNGMKK